jgi:hypothetical protein
MAPLQAAATYGELVDQLDRLGLWHESARIREKLASALAGAGRHVRALHVVADAARLYREASDQEGVARVAALTEMLERERSSAEGS